MVVVHVIIIYLCLTKSRWRLFIATLFLSLWRQSAVDSGVSVKPGLGHLGHWQTVQIGFCSVCLNYSKVRVKWNSIQSSFRTISQPTLRDNRPTSASALWLQRRQLPWPLVCFRAQQAPSEKKKCQSNFDRVTSPASVSVPVHQASFEKGSTLTGKICYQGEQIISF